MKLMNVGKKLHVLFVTLCLGAQLPAAAGALVPAAEQMGPAAWRAWQAASRVPSKVPQSGYSTTQPTSRIQQAPDSTVIVEPRTTAARQAAARSMMSTGRQWGYGALAGKSVARPSMFARRGFASQVVPLETGLKKLTRADFEKMIKMRSSDPSDRGSGVFKLVHVDISGEDLSNLDFSGFDGWSREIFGSNLSGTRFNNTKFPHGITIANSVLDGASFSNASLPGALFINNVAIEAKFDRADMRSSQFFNNNFSGVNFNGARLNKTNFSEFLDVKMRQDYELKLGRSPSSIQKRIKRSSRGVNNLMGADIGSADISGANLYRVISDGLTFDDAKFDDYTLPPTDNYEFKESLFMARRGNQRLRSSESTGEEYFWQRGGKQQSRSVGTSSMTELDARMLFGVKAGATPKEVKAAYRKLALKWHPDSISEEDAEQDPEFNMIKKVNAAYEILSK